MNSLNKTSSRVSDYLLYASNGKYIRTATMVTFPNGREVRFMEKLSRAEAIRNVVNILSNEYAYEG